MSPSPRILILEDDAAHAELLLRAFEDAEEGFDVSTAATVAAARDAIRERPADLVLADLKLPDGSGVDLLEPAGDGPWLPVVVMTSQGDERAAVEAMKAGALDYVVKSDRAFATMPFLARRALQQWRQIEERRWAEHELRESERRLSEAQAVAHIGSWELDLTTGRVWRSEEVFRIYGVDPVGLRPDIDATVERVLPADVPRVREALSALQGSGEPRELTFRIRRDDGEVRTLHATGKGELDGGDGPRRIVGTVQDVTEREQLEQQLAHSQKMEAVGRLAAGVAHDFNNLLMGVIGCADIAMDKLEPSAPARSYIRDLRDAASRGAGTVRGLLSFSRKHGHEAGEMGLEESISAAEPLLRTLLGEDIDLRLELEASGATRCAPGQIEQILLNLASNARDAMPDGGRLRITTAESDVDETERLHGYVGLKPGPYLVLTVTDTGCGMDAQTLATALEPFVTTKEPGKGTGLGLSTVYGIARQAGGHVELESERGAGTTVRLWLPHVERAAERPHEPPPTAKTSANGRGETVLVVEDESLVGMTLCHQLREHGYRVLCASRGTEALAILEQHDSPVDLLLTDMVLPGGMRGSDVAAQVEARRPGTPALFISAHTPEMLGANGASVPEPLLTKPVGAEELLRQVRRTIDAARKTWTGAPSSDPRKKRTVLLVEDYAISRQVCHEALEEIGCVVVDASNAAEAFEHISGRAPELDLLLSDFHLPGATGAELAAELWKARPGLPVVYISGHSPEDSSELRAALERPEASFLVKPVGLADLLSHVEERLAR